MIRYFKLLRNKYFIRLFIIFLLIDPGFSIAVFSFYFISLVFLFPYTTYSRRVDQSMEIWCRSRQPLLSGILRTEYKSTVLRTTVSYQSADYKEQFLAFYYCTCWQSYVLRTTVHSVYMIYQVNNANHN